MLFFKRAAIVSGLCVVRQTSSMSIPQFWGDTVHGVANRKLCGQAYKGVGLCMYVGGLISGCAYNTGILW